MFLLNFITICDRTSRSEFVVSVNKYLEARSQKLSVGMRFKMRFEGEEVPERRFSGTIVGVTESTSSRWPDSEWRSLKSCGFVPIFRFNGMSLHQFHAQKEFHHGNWSHLWQQLLRVPNLCRGTSGRDQQFYPRQHQIFLHLACGKHQQSLLQLSRIVNHNVGGIIILPPNSPQPILMASARIVPSPQFQVSQCIGLTKRKP
ncbi:hypothetical protein CsSME_00010352 [Camellia sinensis var. sinensis]